MLIRSRLWWRGFRPHLHRKPCAICQSSTEASSKAFSISHASSSEMEKTFFATPHAAARSPKGVATKETTVVGMRMNGLKEWLVNFPTVGQTTSAVLTSAEGESLQARRRELLPFWKAFVGASAVVPDDVLNGAAAYLDSFCQRGAPGGIGEAEKEQLDPLMALSSTLRVPTILGGGLAVATSTPEEGAREGPPPASLHDDSGVCDGGEFLARVKAVFTSHEDIVKQLNFQRALLAFREIANMLQLPFFLACGTALAARREGYFIPYDEDVDVGIFFEDLLRHGEKARQDGGLLKNTTESGGELDVISASGLASSAILELISLLSSTSNFLVIDVCGTVCKGLEVRFLHVPTSVRLDLNIYYPPLPDDESLVAAFGGPFVWTATYYADADSRKHRMYRYRHHPFRDELEDTTFCIPSSPSEGRSATVGGEPSMKLPPIRYLVESFGEDWQTPKKFSYFQGLTNGYRNIIEE